MLWMGGAPFSFTWFSSLGMVALSVSRFYGVRHPIPFPEIFLFLYRFSFEYFFQGLGYLKTPAFDEALYMFDRNFGYFELTLMKLVHQSPLMFNFLRVTYLSFTFVEVLVYFALPVTIRRTYAIAVALGVAIIFFYLVCPGAGPVYSLITTVSDLQVPPSITHPHVRILHDVALNACSSGHVTWALLMFWFARRYSKRLLQILSGVFLALTCLATLGLGEHFVIDLVVAVPFAAAIWALVHGQLRLAIISMVSVLAWLVALRQGWALAVPPALAWILTGMTISCFTLYTPSPRRSALGSARWVPAPSLGRPGVLSGAPLPSPSNYRS